MVSQIDLRSIQGFLTHKRKEGCEKEYLDHSEAVLQFYFGYCLANKINLQKIKLEACKDIQYALSNRGLSSRTVNQWISTMRVFYNYLMLTEQTMINPFLLLSSLKVIPVIPTWVPISDIKRIFYQIDSGMFVPTLQLAIFECMYGTGIKAVELKNLGEHDYDKQNESLIVRNKKNKQSFREVPLPAGSVYILKHYITFRKMRYPMANHLFVSKNGKQLTHKMIREAINDLLVRVSSKSKGANAIKFSYRAHLLQAGAEIEKVAKLVGGISSSLSRFDETDLTGRMKQIHELCHPKG